MVNEVVTTPTGTAIDTASGLHYLVPNMSFSDVMALTAANYADRIIFISDMGIHGSLWKCNGIYWAPIHDVTLISDSQDHVLENTVNTDQNFFEGFIIPKGALNPKSRIIIKQSITMGYSTYTKWIRTYLVTDNSTGIAIERIRTLGYEGYDPTASPPQTPPPTILETAEVEVINRNSYGHQLHPYRLHNYPDNVPLTTERPNVHTTTVDTSQAVTVIPKFRFATTGGGLKKATLQRFEIILKA